jgi:hypothetical protein
MTRQELIALVEVICNDNSCTEKQIGKFIKAFEEAIPHPAGLDLVEHPSLWGLSSDSTPEQIVDFALDWHPVFIVAKVENKYPDTGCFFNRIVVPNKISGNVIACEEYNTGDHCIIATSGKSYRGQIVKHGFVKHKQDKISLFTIGQLVAKTDLPVGTIVESVE